MISSTLNKQQSFSGLQSKLLSTGNELVLSPQSVPKVDIDATEELIFSLEEQLLEHQQNLRQLPLNKNESPIVASRLLPNVKIWKDKLSSSVLDTLTTKLSQTLDQESTSNEKDLTPFWTLQSEEISKSLWLPTEIDCVDSVLSSSNESSNNTPMGKSWFSIKTKRPLKKNLSETSFQLSQFSLPDSMDSEVISLKKKSKNKPQDPTQEQPFKPKKYKSIKLRLFPTKQQTETLHLMIDQQRWYYNALISIMNKNFSDEVLYLKKKNDKDPKKYDKDSWNASVIRGILEQYEYKEEVQLVEGKEVLTKDFIPKTTPSVEGKSSFPFPYSLQTGEAWWTSVHNRIPRGAVAKYTSSLNSGISNLRGGYIQSHKMKFQSRKKPTEFLHFDDGSFPSICTQIQSRYWFRTPRNNKQRKYEKTGTKKMRSWISLSDIISQTKKNGLEIIYDKLDNRYYLQYPVEETWYPIQDFRSENQAAYKVEKDTIISLDPGVRKFLVGYDPKGVSIFFGEDVQKQMIPMLLEIDESDQTKKEECLRKWKRVKNLVKEMHWKCISYLIKNYETIMYPDYRVSQMLKKNKIGRMTKRLMTMYSSYEFKEKLKYQCSKYGRRLIIVDESYTSCTCGKCGFIHKNLNGNKVFNCPACEVSMDRDASGSRNILLKNLRRREDICISVIKEKKVSARKPRVTKVVSSEGNSLVEEKAKQSKID